MRRNPAWTGLRAAAVFSVFASAEAVADETTALRVRLHEKIVARGYAAPRGGRFRLRLRGTTPTPPSTSFTLRLGDLTIDEPLVRGRSKRRAAGNASGVHARVTSRNGRIAVDAWGVVRDGAGSALGARVLDACRDEYWGEPVAPHGLFAGEAVLDGVKVPVVVGVTGRFTEDDRDDEPRMRLSIAAAGISPVADAAAPVVAFVPEPAGRKWDGRIRGMALAVGAAPRLSYATSTGRKRAVEPFDAAGDLEVGEGTRLVDGVSSLALPEGTVFQARFDAAVQAPSGAQSVVLRAVDAAGRVGRAAREFEVPAADPPLLADVNSQILEVRADRALWAWGENLFGEVGDGTTRQPFSPVPLPEPTDVVSVAAGDMVSFAVDGTGQVWIWGDWDTTVSLGGGVYESYSVAGNRPKPFPGLVGIAAVSAGMWDDGALALDTDGVVWRLGEGDVDESSFGRTRVRGIPRVQAISQGIETTLALDRLGQVWDLHADPVLVAGLPRVRAVSAGNWSEAVALGDDGTVWQWTTGTDAASPAPISLPRSATAVSAGDGYYGALLDDGTVWTWGGDSEFDDGSGEQSEGSASGPARVRGLENIVSLWVGRGSTALAVDRDGATWTWASGEESEPGREAPTLAPREFRPGHFPEEYLTLFKAPGRRARR